MPLLSRRTPALAVSAMALERPAPLRAAPPSAGFFETCANPACSTGWLHLLRSRSAPVFENGWNCSAECTAARLRTAVGREMEGFQAASPGYRPRVPLGLLMLEQGWITPRQLRNALEAQKAAGGGKLGQWLVAREGIREELVTRSLALQWSCPVLSLDPYNAEASAALLPRLFVDAFGALPLRGTAGKLVYLGFEDRPDPVLALALERMTGIRVEGGVVQDSLFRPAHQRMLKSVYPPAELLEAATESALVRALARLVERARPSESRLVRVHDFLWLRLWLRPQAGSIPAAGEVRDVLCTLAGQ